jgi:hypothetical protein
MPPSQVSARFSEMQEWPSEVIGQMIQRDSGEDLDLSVIALIRYGGE